MFRSVAKNFNLPELENEILEFWREKDIEQQYLERNAKSNERFSFLDGPITANGPMAVHHAWGRTYKDLWQRYNTMLGKRQRYQNGFDCQGLWVEVTVERQLGFTSKLDIEEFGIAEFVRLCEHDVLRWADLQTRQSKRLGYFMDWDHSYFTMSDENNYTIWHFLKTSHQRGLLYQGTDVMPWCTRCGTGLSETEMAEGYQDIIHRSVYVRFALSKRPNEYLLVWTTTPWTLTSNVAVAVNPDLPYVKVRQSDDVYYLAKGAVAALRGEYQVLDEMPGSALLNWHYHGPFDDLPAADGAEHMVIPWADVSEEEGTGLVHIAPGCGKEDFALGKQFGFKAIAPLDQFGLYGEGFGWLTGRDVHEVAEDIVTNLGGKGVLYYDHQYAHRYPTCWRCGTQLIFRLVDEWFISMGPLRDPMMDVVRSIRWIPPYGLDRELDWLRNMDDWMISKKRYWGLALPFWICPNKHLQVIGGKEELLERAVSGADQLESPHRPWVDAVTIACPECGEVAHRIQDVGNPWLDAGIVPFSTMGYNSDRETWKTWFPANFITESFPGQFRNWFYSLLAMSTVLEDTAPFETVLGYALVRDQQGREMHKSWGNAIPFDDAADRAGADVMRWLFAQHTPDANLNFGWDTLDVVKRQLLTLWNTYSFFVTYANLDGWHPGRTAPPLADRPQVDRWIVSRLNQLVSEVRTGLHAFDAQGPARAIDAFIEDMSTWYIRRSRRRFWRAENDLDKEAAYSTLYHCLTVLTRLLAPFMPFIAEAMYQNLVAGYGQDAALSVHLTSYPSPDTENVDRQLLGAMEAAQRVVALGRAARDRASIKVRQPLARIFVRTPGARSTREVEEVREVILEELNVKELEFVGAADEFVVYTIRPNLPALGPRYGKRLPKIRQALAARDALEVVETVEKGEDLVLPLDGATVTLHPDDILISAEQREDFAAVAADGYLVALDTQLTSELINEGLARGVIHIVNNGRKEAGFNVEDRVAIRFEASAGMRVAIEEHHAYIQQETLAVSLDQGLIESAPVPLEAAFGGEWIRFQVERIAP